MDQTEKYEIQRMCYLLEWIHELSEGEANSLYRSCGYMFFTINIYNRSCTCFKETLDFKGVILIPPETQVNVEDRTGPSQVDEDDDSDDDSLQMMRCLTMTTMILDDNYCL